mgnify:FL=1|jgi:hypothetical protein|tara:strand:- start:4377 stop:4652 length:276 start_codon:yes stop_codon:yes gene_type:complete
MAENFVTDDKQKDLIIKILLIARFAAEQFKFMGIAKELDIILRGVSFQKQEMGENEDIKKLSKEEYNKWMQKEIQKSQGTFVAGCKGDDCD